MDKAQFTSDVKDALANSSQRGFLEFVMGNFRRGRKNMFNDEEETKALRLAVSNVRERTIGNLANVLERLEEKCTANGIQVH